MLVDHEARPRLVYGEMLQALAESTSGEIRIA
jgi:hypothetical protein